MQERPPCLDGLPVGERAHTTLHMDKYTNKAIFECLLTRGITCARAFTNNVTVLVGCMCVDVQCLGLCKTCVSKIYSPLDFCTEYLTC